MTAVRYSAASILEHPALHVGHDYVRASDFDALQAENARLRAGMTGDYDLDAWLEWTAEKSALVTRTDEVFEQSVRLRESIRVALANVDNAAYTHRRNYPGTAASIDAARQALTPKTV